MPFANPRFIADRALPFALAGLLAAGPAAAQTLRVESFGLGFAANAPRQMLGGTFSASTDALGGLGLLLDARFDADDRADEPGFESTLDADQVPSRVGGAVAGGWDESWTGISASLLRRVTPDLSLYAGAGVSWARAYRQFAEPSRAFGVFGTFWVRDPGVDRTELNVVAGALLRAHRNFSFRAGFETAPRGMTVGGLVLFPR